MIRKCHCNYDNELFGMGLISEYSGCAYVPV